jgi:hypothetical protein
MTPLTTANSAIKFGHAKEAGNALWCGADLMKARDIVLVTRVTEEDKENTDDCENVHATS